LNWVASLQESGYYGGSTGATLWAGGSCKGKNDEYFNRTYQAGVEGASAINLSWGCDPTKTNTPEGQDASDIPTIIRTFTTRFHIITRIRQLLNQQVIATT
jgi:hypothetical protein